MFWDNSFFIFVIPALLIGLYAQMKVKSTFSRYAEVRSIRGYTGAQAAQRILEVSGIRNVTIERVAGDLTDHFDPRTNTLRLSQTVHDSTSLAALGVAAHEAGHAIQHAEGYVPIRVRNAIVPVANIGSYLAFPLVLLGVFFASFQSLAWVGILLFFAVVLFQFVTLPVEFNASSRAVVALNATGILDEDEARQSKKVLSAAALTYVAATISAVLTLLRLLYLVGFFGGRRDN